MSENVTSEEKAKFKEGKYDAARLYLSRGLSVLPTTTGKKPLGEWKKFQSERMRPNEIQSYFQGDKVNGIGVICGKVSGNLEVIDVDCKYDKTGQLFENLSNLIGDHLPEVWERLVIVKTVNNGYHIYYHCEVISGNQKLAINEDKTVLIETRGEGGYVLAPPTPGYKNEGTYKSDKIPTISIEERECLMAICRSLNFEPNFQPEVNVEQDQREFLGLSPFDDYNNRGDVVSLLESHGWTRVNQIEDRIHFKRPGKTDSLTSANFLISKKLFYVWSSSTSFDAGRAYNPVQIYTILECNNDYSESSKRLYSDGYGDRRLADNEVQGNKKATSKQQKINLLPIEGMPIFIQNFTITCSETFGTPRDYWAGAAIMATALGMGDAIELKTKFKNTPILWMNLIGDVSSGKTEAQDFCIKPFEIMDSVVADQYKKDYQSYDHIEQMGVKERRENGVERMPRPTCHQYIVKDSTPEALTLIHSVNQRGLLISRDELKGWLDDFGRYSKSGEQSNMLSSFNRVRMVTNRKGGGKDSVLDIPKPCILVFGGMQPDLIPMLAADNRQENGFLARFCNVYPDQSDKPTYNKSVVSEELKNQWNNYIVNLTRIQRGEIFLSIEADNMYSEWFNRNCKISNDEESGYLKGVYGKLDIIALRMAIIIYGMNLCNGREYSKQINLGDMQTALDITEYFRSTALKVYHKLFDCRSRPISKKDVIRFLFSLKNSHNEIATVTKVSQQYVNKILNER